MVIQTLLPRPGVRIINIRIAFMSPDFVRVPGLSMARLSYEISDDNRRRLELLRAFGMMEGRETTLQGLVNAAIEGLFEEAFAEYCSEPKSEILRLAMERLAPSMKGSGEGERRILIGAGATV